LISSGVSAADGSFELSGDCQKGTYNVAAIKVDYEKNDADFVVENSSDTSDIILQLDKITKRAAVGTDLSKYLKLRPVYFDLDKSNIRPDAAATMNEVVAYLNTFPDMKVEVQSHTDVRASDRYNLRLSNRRARSTVAWLIEKGIDPSRITGKGFGETILTNDCTTRNSCTDERHEENRRSEFIVVE
jgi:outer membrane protein OmpA-like peptidoglycan-associated protein